MIIFSYQNGRRKLRRKKVFLYKQLKSKKAIQSFRYHFRLGTKQRISGTN
jgi:hypothetical protein